MNVRAIRMPLVVLLVGVMLAVGLSACTSDDDDASDSDGALGAESGWNDPDTSDRFIGLPRDEAAILAESEGRQWRIGARDGESLPLTADLVARRVTFELEQDIVTGVQIEPAVENDRDPSTALAEDDADAAAILAAAVRQILTVDHNFGVGSPPPFDDVRVADAIGDTGGSPLAELQLEAIAAVVQDTGATVEFTDNPGAMIEDLFNTNSPGVAVVTVDAVRLAPGRAEVDLRLWCGSLCGVYLTYEVVEVDGAWTVTGPIGPIAVS